MGELGFGINLKMPTELNQDWRYLEDIWKYYLIFKHKANNKNSMKWNSDDLTKKYSFKYKAAQTSGLHIIVWTPNEAWRHH